LLHRCEAHLAF